MISRPRTPHLKQNLDDLGEDGQQTAVVHTDAALQQRQQTLHLGRATRCEGGCAEKSEMGKEKARNNEESPDGERDKTRLYQLIEV